MTARIVMHATYRRTKVKTQSTAHPIETEAAMSKTNNSVRITELNDSLRRTFSGGKVVMTDGVAVLPEGDLSQLLAKVRNFNEFTNDNDPHGEHDFGTIEVGGETYFFKLDYYAPNMDGGSEDPADLTKTTRVFTIMRADEY
jgi:Protein of unknown function (DUF3768)